MLVLFGVFVQGFSYYLFRQLLFYSVFILTSSNFSPYFVLILRAVFVFFNDYILFR
jgi:hypothetical protein